MATPRQAIKHYMECNKVQYHNIALTKVYYLTDFMLLSKNCGKIILLHLRDLLLDFNDMLIKKPRYSQVHTQTPSTEVDRYIFISC